MSTRAKIGLAVAIVGFLLWVVLSSFNLSQFTCEVCIEHNGLTNCGSASGATQMEARSTAISVACATITGGVTDNLACMDRTPVSESCQKN